MTEPKNIAENALEQIVDKPREAENAEGSVKTQNISDLIKLDEHLAKKEAANAGMKPPYGIKTAICKTGHYYG